MRSVSSGPEISSMTRKRSALGLLEAVHRRHVGVLQAGQGAGLALEAGFALGIAAQFGGQDLEGHVAAQLGVAGAEDLAHAALADAVLDLVVQSDLPIMERPFSQAESEIG